MLRLYSELFNNLGEFQYVISMENIFSFYIVSAKKAKRRRTLQSVCAVDMKWVS